MLQLSYGFRCERYDGNGPLGLSLVLSELRVELSLSRVDFFTFGTDDFLCEYVDRLSSDFYLDVRMGLEVVVPVGIGGSSSLRSEDEVTISVLQIHYRVSPGFAGAGTSVIDKK